MRRRPAFALAVTVLLLALDAPARADFCVGPPTPSFNDLQTAIDAAALTPGTDTITVAPGTYEGGKAMGVNPVNVVGAGPTQTTLVGPSDPVVQLVDGSSISSLHISVTQTTTSPFGLRIANSTASDLLVDLPRGVQGQRAVSLDGAGRLERSTISLPVPPGPPGNLGIDVQNTGPPGRATVSDARSRSARSRSG